MADCASVRTKGFFFGYFWAIYMSSQIVGCYLAAIVLKNFNLVTFYFVMAGFIFISGILFITLRQP